MPKPPLPIKEGWLKKESPSAFAGWQDRWFLLKDGNLCYMKKPNTEVAGIIQCEDIQDVQVDGKQVLVVAPHPKTGDPRKFKVKAATVNEAKEWAEDIKEVNRIMNMPEPKADEAKKEVDKAAKQVDKAAKAASAAITNVFKKRHDPAAPAVVSEPEPMVEIKIDNVPPRAEPAFKQKQREDKEAAAAAGIVYEGGGKTGESGMAKLLGRKAKEEPPPPNVWARMCCPGTKFKKYARIYSFVTIFYLPLAVGLLPFCRGCIGPHLVPGFTVTLFVAVLELPFCCTCFSCCKSIASFLKCFEAGALRGILYIVMAVGLMALIVIPDNHCLTVPILGLFLLPAGIAYCLAHLRGEIYDERDNPLHGVGGKGGSIPTSQSGMLIKMASFKGGI